MIVLVPVSMFNVPFTVAQGRPYSRLEVRVLEDIAQRGGTDTQATLASLRETFHVHQRLLVEAVVTLIGAGWVAVADGREATFALTDEGAKALSTGKDPASVVVRPGMPCTVIMDLTAGQLARRNEVPTVHLNDHEVRRYARTPVRLVRRSLDEAQVDKLLPRASGDWVRSIGRPRLVNFRRYIPVRVSLESQEVVGLPRGWGRALTDHIVSAATKHHDETIGQGEAASNSFDWLDNPGFEPREAQRTTRAKVQAVGTLAGTENHLSVLETAFRTAYRYVLVASPTIEPQVLLRWEGAMRSALKRGVRIDLLYGEATAAVGQGDLVKIANRIGYDAVGQRGRDLMRPSTKPTHCPAGLLSFDRPDGMPDVVVGDFDWLGHQGTGISLHVRGHAIGTGIAQVAAALWRRSGEDASVDRWRRIARSCQDAAALEGVQGELSGSVDVELLVDDEHAATESTPSGGKIFGAAKPCADSAISGVVGVSIREVAQEIGS
ncbi:winged helix DNA-binding protein [Lentzea sp. CC55]|uniref:winged helix DNA-binding protein n=1 Tax=Lentzea sp. CC55 TaxID=2884909 RepID=UPI001F42A52F|nr:winged helix DNA-binding protein [Lentzea sp. CC55]MCG8923208.1 winged helix DNA-binding protein [Lentzea sp. CC55]